jgi:hypothetical protein
MCVTLSKLHKYHIFIYVNILWNYLSPDNDPTWPKHVTHFVCGCNKVRTHGRLGGGEGWSGNSTAQGGEGFMG